MHSYLQLISRFIFRNHKITASVLKISSFVLYAWNDALSKLLTTGSTAALPTHSVIFYQYSLSACFLSVVFLFISPKRDKLVGLTYHIYRVALCTCGILLLNWSFTVMPLSYAVGFNLFSPFLTIMWAYLWFHEPISQRKVSALFLSMIAYLILLDSSKIASDTAYSLQAYLVPSIALLCFQANTIITKHLCRLGESSINLTQLLFVCIPLLLLPFEILHPQSLSIYQFLIIGLMAINGTLAALALHQAIAMADLTFLLPFGFLKYSIVTFFGYIYFVEVPHTNHLIGISLTLGVLYYLNQPDQATLKPSPESPR